MTSSILDKGLPYRVDKSEIMKPYWDGLNNGEFKTTQCIKCSSIHFPPSPKLCPKCFGMNMEWLSLPLSGTITTFTHVTAPPAGFSGDYVLASVLVDRLDKTILGRFIGENLQIGDKVKIAFEPVQEQSIMIFKK